MSKDNIPMFVPTINGSFEDQDKMINRRSDKMQRKYNEKIISP